VIEGKLTKSIQAVAAWLSQALPDDLRWMAAPARRILDYVAGPVIQEGNRRDDQRGDCLPV
jgi:hypothetical protein